MSHSIEGFSKLTRQQIFDISVKHIASTGKKSVDDSGSCVYGGSGCGAAPFIKPSSRAILDNGESTNWLYLARVNLIDNHEKLLVNSIQQAHDCSISHEVSIDAFKTSYVREMRRVAEDYELDTSVLDALNW